LLPTPVHAQLAFALRGVIMYMYIIRGCGDRCGHYLPNCGQNETKIRGRALVSPKEYKRNSDAPYVIIVAIIIKWGAAERDEQVLPI
jgi:hypothetical protein